MLHLALGGTISLLPDERRRAVAALSGEDLRQLAGAPADVVAEDFLRLPSADLTFADLTSLRARIRRAFRDEGQSAVVITMGTDTLEEIAYVLHVWEAWPGPVVVTGAMRHGGLPGPDGAANLTAAYAVARSEAARGRGVLVVMNDEIHSADNVTKFHTQNPATFVSPDWGPVGIVHEGMVTFGRRAPSPVVLPAPALTARVDLVRVALDTHPSLVEAALGGDGVVVEATGGGHVPRPLVAPLEEGVRAGKVAVVCSRAGSGPTLRGTYGYVGGEFDLQERGLLMGDGPGLKLRLRLALALSMDPRPDLTAVCRPIPGEG